MVERRCHGCQDQEANQRGDPASTAQKSSRLPHHKAGAAAARGYQNIGVRNAADITDPLIEAATSG